MSASGRNDVTSKPTVGVVQTRAMMIAASDAHGELSFLPANLALLLRPPRPWGPARRHQQADRRRRPDQGDDDRGQRRPRRAELLARELGSPVEAAATVGTGIVEEAVVGSKAPRGGLNRRAKFAGKKLSSPWASLAAIIIALVWTTPTVGLLVTSFRPEADIRSDGWWN